jgi:type VI secretion system protein ImpK
MGMTQSTSKLTDVFSDHFVLGAYLKDARNLGSPDAFRARLHQLFRSAEEKSKTAGIAQDGFADARYAVTAFLDEMIINSRWAHKEQWTSRPLQYEFVGDFNAGEGFFRRLETIRSSMPLNADLLEVFALCLILGFEGQYKLQDREKLRGLLEDVTREIQARRGDVPALSPHAKRPEELFDLVKREVPAWAPIVISVGIVVFVYLALSLLMSHDAGTVADELKRLLQEVKS